MIDYHFYIIREIILIVVIFNDGLFFIYLINFYGIILYILSCFDLYRGFIFDLCLVCQGR